MTIQENTLTTNGGKTWCSVSDEEMLTTDKSHADASLVLFGKVDI
jgi:hypothetical protein